MIINMRKPLENHERIKVHGNLVVMVIQKSRMQIVQYPCVGEFKWSKNHNHYTCSMLDLQIPHQYQTHSIHYCWTHNTKTMRSARPTKIATAF